MKRTLEALVLFSWTLTFCFGQNTNLFCESGQCNTNESKNIRIEALVTEIRIMKDALESERRERQEEATSLRSDYEEEVTSLRSDYEEELTRVRDETRSTYMRWGRTLYALTAVLRLSSPLNFVFNFNV